MTETLAYGYSSDSTQWELSNEYQHDKVKMFFKNLCVLVPWKKVASASEGLRMIFEIQWKRVIWPCNFQSHWLQEGYISRSPTVTLNPGHARDLVPLMPNSDSVQRQITQTYQNDNDFSNIPPKSSYTGLISTHILTLMLLVANLADTKWCKKSWKLTETLANGYSSESAQRELSNEYQHDRV